jgi:hypothetical protein
MGGGHGRTSSSMAGHGGACRRVEGGGRGRGREKGRARLLWVLGGCHGVAARGTMRWLLLWSACARLVHVMLHEEERKEKRDKKEKREREKNGQKNGKIAKSKNFRGEK